MNMRARLNGWSLGIGVIVGLAFGLGISHRRHHGHGPHGEPFAGKGLTDDEKTHLHEMARASMDKDRPLMAVLDELTKQLRVKLKSKDAKDDDLRRDFAEINDLRHQLAERRFELDLKVRQAIGADRFEGFDPMGPPPGPHGHHGPPGPPPDDREHDRDER